MKMKWMLAAVLLLPLLAAAPLTVAAEAPYQSYVYNEWDQSKAAPASYLPERTYTGNQLGAGAFSDPQDLFVDKRSAVYIADTGNKRIVKLNDRFETVAIIDKLNDNGKEMTLAAPTGLFVTDEGTMYIADKDNGRIIRAGADNKVELVIEKPTDPLIPEGFQFKPTKVAVDNAGRIYVLSEGQFYGLMQFNSKGQFTGYFGSNRVEVTPAVVLETFWKNLLSKEQRSAMMKLLPIEYSNLEVGADNFVYTTTIISKNSREEIKKLNPLGNNVLMGQEGGADFGDKEFSFKQGVKQDTSFVDLSIDAEGFIAGLDRTRGRIFEYDSEGNPIAVFGSLGNQNGTFLQPSAVSYWNGEVLVLDTAKRNITRFALSEYGGLVRQATVLYNQGLYEEAAVIWKSVAKRNANNSIAYVGIAKALEKEGSYDEALAYYRQGTDRSGYSDTFGQVRMQTVRSNLPVIMTVFILAIAGYYGYKAFAAARNKRRKEVTR
ncbi:gluconolactonase [Candidatus Pristimantibacillus sp. PTI5]|uniref:gluconolactonase n=1 Tax=Candidatus Pristimantibacillus sp. PTI5 TaxID=3400422 RepID=UPI003B028DE8